MDGTTGAGGADEAEHAVDETIKAAKSSTWRIAAILP
jgi:hypothetical protein